MILEKIKEDLKNALKTKDELRIATLRFLLSSIHNKEIEKKQELTDEEIIPLIQKQIKERKESIEAFRKGKREDLASKEEKELEILSSYLPQQASEEEVFKAVKESIEKVGAKGVKDFGVVMKEVMARLRGRVDGSKLAEKVREELSKS